MNLGDVISVLFILYVTLIVVVMVLERRKASTTIAWLLILLFLPYAGFVLYLFFGRDISKKSVFRRRDEALAAFRSLPEEQIRLLLGRNGNGETEEDEFDGLIQMNMKMAGAAFTRDNLVEILTDGQEKFRRLSDSIRQAVSHVHLEYYIFREDTLGNALMELLEETAARGVQVRLLIDGVGNRISRKRLDRLRAAGVSVAIFFPNRFLPYIELLVNHRNHRKVAVIDGQEGYTGGFNVGDDYLGDGPMGYWRDTHLLIRGSAVADLQAHFAEDWFLASGEDLSSRQELFPVPAPAGDAGLQVVASGPESPQEQIKYAFLEMISSARECICIQTPYFIPDDPVFEAIKIALFRGVRVRIMVPNKPDHMFVYWATYSYLGDLLPYGLEAYTYENGFLHAKTMVVDNRVFTCGTTNFDIRSFKLNFEVNVFSYSQEVAGQYMRIFEEDVRLSRQLTWEDYRMRPWPVRIKEPVARLLSPLL